MRGVQDAVAALGAAGPDRDHGAVALHVRLDLTGPVIPDLLVRSLDALHSTGRDFFALRAPGAAGRVILRRTPVAALPRVLRANRRDCRKGRSGTARLAARPCRPSPAEGPRRRAVMRQPSFPSRPSARAPFDRRSNQRTRLPVSLPLALALVVGPRLLRPIRSSSSGLGGYRVGPHDRLAWSAARVPRRSRVARSWSRPRRGACWYSARHRATSPAASFALDGSRCVHVGGTDDEPRIELWDPQRRWLLKTFAPEPQPLERVSLAPDGRTIVVSGPEIHVHDAPTGARVRELETDGPRQAHTHAFSPDGSGSRRPVGSSASGSGRRAAPARSSPAQRLPRRGATIPPEFGLPMPAADELGYSADGRRIAVQ